LICQKKNRAIIPAIGGKKKAQANLTRVNLQPDIPNNPNNWSGDSIN
jgi:hypothetical protein